MKAAEIVLALELVVIFAMIAVLAFRAFGPEHWRKRLSNLRHHLLDKHS